MDQGARRSVKPETITDQLQFNRRWRPALMSYFLRRVGNHAEAEDLTQDVFARLLASGAEAQAHHGYVFQVASNLLADRARRAKIRSAYRDDLKSDPEQGIEALDPHRLAASREAIAIFRRNLAGLPERTRIMFTLYRIEEMSLDEIADTFGVSKSAVKKHVHAAMITMMRRMRGKL
jgi:RNA polymerase sigma-70 factor (ECF subfamily)